MRRQQAIAVLAVLAAASAVCRPGSLPNASGKTHRAAGVLCATDETRVGYMTGFCVGPRDNLLVCDALGKQIKVVSTEDELVDTWKLPAMPLVVGMGHEQNIYVGAKGEVIKLSRTGKLVTRISGGKLPAKKVASVTAGPGGVFVAFANYQVWRLDHDLKNSVKVVGRARGCCGNLDIVACEDGFIMAENGRKRIVHYNRKGKALKSWGKSSRRTGGSGFAGCCNPMNLTLAADGSVFTSSSGGGGVRHFSIDGKFLRYVGIGIKPSGCKRVTVGSSSGGAHVYVMDTTRRHITILAGKPVAVAKAK